MTASVIEDLISVFHRLHQRDVKNRAYTGNHRMQEGRMLLQLIDAGAAGVNVSELSRAMRVTSPFVTQLLNKLEEAGMVVRARDESDRRIVRVRLTAKGAEAAEAVRSHRHQVLVGLSERLGEEDCRQLVRLLHQTFDYFDERLAEQE